MSGLLTRDLSALGALAKHGRGEGPVELAALARETVSASVARRALMLEPERLPPSRRKPANLAQLRSAFDHLRRNARIRVFDLPHGGLVAVAPPPAPLLEDALTKLKALLDDRELAAGVADLRLPDQAAVLMQVVERALGLPTGVPRKPKPLPKAPPGPDADLVATVEQHIATIDIESMMRREWVCRITEDAGAPQPLWEERRVRLDLVAQSLLPGTDLRSTPWLRRRLRRALDRRLIGVVTRADEIRSLRALVLPLGLEAVTSPEFLRLDARLPVALRGALTVMVEAEELLSDPTAGAMARRWLSVRGHKLGLEINSPEAVKLFPPTRTGYKVLRLNWTEDMPGLGTEGAERLKAALAAMPSDVDVVLAGVDRAGPIAWGWEKGISLFQGRLVEQRRSIL